jgi:hypothetical protein
MGKGLGQALLDVDRFSERDCPWFSQRMPVLIAATRLGEAARSAQLRGSRCAIGAKELGSSDQCWGFGTTQVESLGGPVCNGSMAMLVAFARTAGTWTVSIDGYANDRTCKFVDKLQLLAC